MYPSDFAYAAPTSLREAIQLLQQNPEAKVLAGGHSLLPAMRIRLMNPPMLVDIGRIGELRGIHVNGGVSIGALTTYHDLQTSDALKQHLAVLAESAANVGDPQVRNKGTLGGALAHADPAADMTAVILALGAELKVVGPQGERTISADDFFVGMLETALQPGEILATITIPAMPAGHGAAYEKFKHPASGYAVVGVAAMVHQGVDGAISACRIAVTGAGPLPQRARAAEDALLGGASVADAAAKASDGLDFIGDVYAGEDYRAHLTRVLARRALQRAMG
jgi:aerobic carbon-monoxide dehydrogenase medium subunit